MKNKKNISVISLALLLSACGQQESGEQIVKQPESVQQSTRVTGKILHTKFAEEQSRVDGGMLTIRQGKDFFADASVDVVLFDNSDLSGKTFSSDVKPGQIKPHLRLGIRKSGERLPDTTTLLDDYDLKLTFGNGNALGIPYEIQLASAANGTQIAGASFATYKDIRLTNGKIDLHYDSFDTLEHLARAYLGLDQAAAVNARFGVSYKSFSDDYPKTGFVGLEYTGKSGEPAVAKVQLLKDADGWKAVNSLTGEQIHQAHPVAVDFKGNERIMESLKAEHAAAVALEKFLNDKELIKHTRTTNIDCYLTKDRDKASCRGVYGLKQDGDVQCQNKNYLLVKDGAEWKVSKEIQDGQKVDYTSGELVEQKPKSMHCQ